jgi:sugar O-acyltransferase (sialic acid O-acetyltransferase NeuD family)
MEEIFIFGAGGHFHSVADVIEAQGLYQIAGIIDNESAEEKMDYSRLNYAFVAIGDNWKRSQVVQKILSKASHAKFPAIIHPRAVISPKATIGFGTVVMAGAVINTLSTVGEHCIVNTSSSLDHGCRLSNYSSVAPGVTLGGDVSVGTFSAISLGAKVIQQLEIGQHVVVGAGAIVTKSVEDYCVTYGNPSRFVRARGPGDTYLVTQKKSQATELTK